MAIVRTLRSLLATLVIDAPVSGEVWLDDRQLGTAPDRWLVPSGRHIVEVRANRHESQRREVQLVAGQARSESLELQRFSTYAGPGQGYFWAATSLTAAATVAGATFGLQALSARVTGENGPSSISTLEPTRSARAAGRWQRTRASAARSCSALRPRFSTSLRTGLSPASAAMGSADRRLGWTRASHSTCAAAPARRFTWSSDAAQVGVLAADVRSVVAVLELQLDGLSAQDRQILCLFYFQNLGANEISERTHFDRSTVYRQLHRAERRLAQRVTSLIRMRWCMAKREECTALIKELSGFVDLRAAFREQAD
jgi:predicted DNA-binding protein YlxM (UPF0122 family)